MVGAAKIATADEGKLSVLATEVVRFAKVAIVSAARSVVDEPSRKTVTCASAVRRCRSCSDGGEGAAYQYAKGRGCAGGIESWCSGQCGRSMHINIQSDLKHNQNQLVSDVRRPSQPRGKQLGVLAHACAPARRPSRVLEIPSGKDVVMACKQTTSRNLATPANIAATDGSGRQGGCQSSAQWWC